MRGYEVAKGQHVQLTDAGLVLGGYDSTRCFAVAPLVNIREGWINQLARAVNTLLRVENKLS